jgi:hypothetical protein
MSGRYRPIPAHVGPGARRIIQGLLVVDAARRMDLEEVAQDPWLLSAAMEYGECTVLLSGWCMVTVPQDKLLACAAHKSGLQCITA